MSAARHWIGLDDVMRRLLPPGAIHARKRFAHRAAALTDIYVSRIQKTLAAPVLDHTSVARQLQDLQRAHSALTAALTRTWTQDREYGGRDDRERS
jgi:hypothetical protein